MDYLNRLVKYVCQLWVGRGVPGETSIYSYFFEPPLNEEETQRLLTDHELRRHAQVSGRDVSTRTKQP